MKALERLAPSIPQDIVVDENIATVWTTNTHFTPLLMRLSGFSSVVIHSKNRAMTIPRVEQQGEYGQVGLWVDVPYNIAPMIPPLALVTSKWCRGYEICGALELFDQVDVMCEESGTVRGRMTGEKLWGWVCGVENTMLRGF